MGLSTLPMYLKSDRLQRNQMESIKLFWHITGAKTNAQIAMLPQAAIVGYDNTDLTQAKVEAYLGHTSAIVCATAFSATSMGTDAFGFVVDCAGNCQSVYAMESKFSITAGGAAGPVLTDGSTSALTSSLSTAVAVSSDGDVYGRVIYTGLDAATAGYIELELFLKWN